MTVAISSNNTNDSAEDGVERMRIKYIVLFRSNDESYSNSDSESAMEKKQRWMTTGTSYQRTLRLRSKDIEYQLLLPLCLLGVVSILPDPILQR